LDNIDLLVEEIFGNLGLEIDPPKDYMINLMNFITRRLNEYEWYGSYQIEDITLKDDEASVLFYPVDVPIPIVVEIRITRSMDYNRSGIMYIVYDISINATSEIDYVTSNYHQAEEYLFNSNEILSGVYNQAIELIDSNHFSLKGELSNGIDLSIIPISSDHLAEEITENWSEIVKEKTNFKSIALEISNVPDLINQHYNEVITVFQWFKERGITSRYASFENTEDGNFDSSNSSI
jgi:hypothetical protein